MTTKRCQTPNDVDPFLLLTTPLDDREIFRQVSTGTHVGKDIDDGALSSNNGDYIGSREERSDAGVDR